MIEVLFTDSAKNAMKIAKKYNSKYMINRAMSYIGNKPSKSEFKKQFEGQAIDGSSEDVVYIGFSLDIGDISGEVDGIYRQEVFNNIFYNINSDAKVTEAFFNLQIQDIEKVLVAAKQGIPIRIWKSNLPFSHCSFAFICDMLRNIDCEISAISLPEYVVMPGNTIVFYSSWGEINPGQFYRFLSYEKELSKIEKVVQAGLWQELKTENSPLRAIVNGKLISVPENFYDHLIINNIPDDEFVMARLIGNILGKYPLGVSDGWYAFRINKMIDENMLKVVSDNKTSHPYQKILKRIAL